MKRIRVSWINSHDGTAEIAYIVYEAENTATNDYDDEGNITGTSKKNLSIVATGEIWLQMPYDSKVLQDNLLDIVTSYKQGIEAVEVEA
jgi:hypothetical protein